jgi:hypothetical protein
VEAAGAEAAGVDAAGVEATGGAAALELPDEPPELPLEEPPEVPHLALGEGMVALTPAALHAAWEPVYSMHWSASEQALSAGRALTQLANLFWKPESLHRQAVRFGSEILQLVDLPSVARVIAQFFAHAGMALRAEVSCGTA